MVDERKKKERQDEYSTVPHLEPLAAPVAQVAKAPAATNPAKPAASPATTKPAAAVVPAAAKPVGAPEKK